MKELVTIALFASVLISGCSSFKPVEVKQVSHSMPRKIVADKSLAVTEVKKNLKSNVIGQHTIGTVLGGFPICSSGSALALKGDSLDLLNAMKENANSLFAEYKHNAIKSMHADQQRSVTDYSVVARITDIKANICYMSSLLFSGAKGEIYIAVEWDFYDSKTNRVIGTFKTEGYAKSEDWVRADTYLFIDAFRMNAINLLADENIIRTKY